MNLHDTTVHETCTHENTVWEQSHVVGASGGWTLSWADTVHHRCIDRRHGVCLDCGAHMFQERGVDYDSAKFFSDGPREWTIMDVRID